jgi:ATP-binding cassette subfamily B protein
MLKTFPYYAQPDQMDCGPTCLRMITKYYGRNFKLQTLRQLCEISKGGSSLLGISNAAEKIGFRTQGVKISIEQLKDIDLPCILYWRQNHFIILYKISNNTYHIADPSGGLVKLDQTDFNRNWFGKQGDGIGIALLLTPTPIFYEQEDEVGNGIQWSFLFKYLTAYKKLILQLFIGLGVGTLLLVITPFLTQSVVDIGINTRNLGFIYIILIAQSALILGRVSVDFIRSWILLHISTRINISILTDFLIKLMKLPMSFFDAKMTGDIMQRMADQQNIEGFLTGSALNTIFSMFSLVVFSVVLLFFNATIYLVFAVSSTFYILWILLFLKRRRLLNYKKFDISSQNQSSIVQLVGGMQEIKLNNCEQQKRWEWEGLQASLFKFQVKSLALTQYQQGGSTFIVEGTGLLITFLSAKSVVDGNLTIGGMVAMQYIIGQLNGPIQQFLGFIQSFQDAKISIERLNEIHLMDDEEPIGKEWINVLPNNKSLLLNNITFHYPGAGNSPVLTAINIKIPQGKTTAIVGMSGSGKTTILKLLLRFYEPDKGEIKVGEQDLNNIGFRLWRSQCGVVMQDGFIFSDTIARNIAVGDDYLDTKKLEQAIEIANIGEFIDGLPLGVNTKIGLEGNGISQGQRQRILIARAVYKDPEYLFFDEATNALDANNELVIMNKLQEFFKGRTVVVVAHRLSTVSNADNIIVLNKGVIIEQGSHQQLIAMKGSYYHLIKNQLELGL